MPSFWNTQFIAEYPAISTFVIGLRDLYQLHTDTMFEDKSSYWEEGFRGLNLTLSSIPEYDYERIFLDTRKNFSGSDIAGVPETDQSFFPNVWHVDQSLAVFILRTSKYKISSSVNERAADDFFKSTVESLDEYVEVHGYDGSFVSNYFERFIAFVEADPVLRTIKYSSDDYEMLISAYYPKNKVLASNLRDLLSGLKQSNNFIDVLKRHNEESIAYLRSQIISGDYAQTRTLVSQFTDLLGQGLLTHDDILWTATYLAANTGLDRALSYQVLHVVVPYLAPQERVHIIDQWIQTGIDRGEYSMQLVLGSGGRINLASSYLTEVLGLFVPPAFGNLSTYGANAPTYSEREIQDAADRLLSLAGVRTFQAELIEGIAYLNNWYVFSADRISPPFNQVSHNLYAVDEVLGTISTLYFGTNYGSEVLYGPTPHSDGFFRPINDAFLHLIQAAITGLPDATTILSQTEVDKQLLTLKTAYQFIQELGDSEQKDAASKAFINAIASRGPVSVAVPFLKYIYLEVNYADLSILSRFIDIRLENVSDIHSIASGLEQDYETLRKNGSVEMSGLVLTEEAIYRLTH
jgi:hypothetical protein